jgi:hypothetical protein
MEIYGWSAVAIGILWICVEPFSFFVCVPLVCLLIFIFRSHSAPQVVEDEAEAGNAYGDDDRY